MKVACCDDVQADLELLINYCKRYDSSLQLYSYTTAKDMLNAYSSDLFDVVFLDIEMAHPNGYEAAVQLSHEQNPPIVIFTTQTLDYAVRGYGLALRYLPKPISYEMFRQTLQLAIEQKAPLTINITTNTKVEVVIVSDITYIEVMKRQVIIHLSSRPDLSLNCSFETILGKLPDNRFVQTHKSYCVNLNHVMRMEQNTLTLTDGTQLPIGRNYKAHLRERLIEFLKEAN